MSLAPPLVSVVVPAYNCSEFIDETLESLFAQDYPNVEIVVVNDGSTDGTLARLSTYAERIRIVDQPNAGAPVARNRGMQAARGDFVCFCDADDIWAKTKIGDQVAYLQAHPDVGMVYCDWYVWEPDSQGVFRIPPDFGQETDRQAIDPALSGWIYHKLLLDCVCLTSSVMFRKSILEQVGEFDPKLWNGDDYNYWLRTSRITEIHKLRSRLVLYRILPRSVARTPTSVHYEYEVVQDALARWGGAGPTGIANEKKTISARLAQMRFSFGYLYLNSDNPLSALNYFAKSIRHRPSWHLPWLYSVLSIWKLTTKRN